MFELIKTLTELDGPVGQEAPVLHYICLLYTSAGILAAAAIVAVTEMVERLSDDHANAKQLAEGLAQLDGIAINPADVETNLVFFELTSESVTPAQLVNGLAAHGVKLNAASGRRLRAVLNYHVTSADVAQVLTAFRTVLSEPVHANGQKVVAYG